LVRFDGGGCSWERALLMPVGTSDGAAGIDHDDDMELSEER